MTYSWLAIFRQAHVQKRIFLLEASRKRIPNDRKPLAGIVVEGYFLLGYLSFLA
jgi:hypothetical protein